MIKCTIWGNLTRDGEFRQTPSGQDLLTLNVGTSERWTDKSGEERERRTFCRVDVWGKLAEAIYMKAKKGSRVYIDGVRYRYDEKLVGDDVKKYHFFESTWGTRIDIRGTEVKDG